MEKQFRYSFNGLKIVGWALGFPYFVSDVKWNFIQNSPIPMATHVALCRLLRMSAEHIGCESTAYKLVCSVPTKIVLNSYFRTTTFRNSEERKLFSSHTTVWAVFSHMRRHCHPQFYKYWVEFIGKLIKINIKWRNGIEATAFTTLKWINLYLLHISIFAVYDDGRVEKPEHSINMEEFVALLLCVFVIPDGCN